jgi:hypothetical protein
MPMTRRWWALLAIVVSGSPARVGGQSSDARVSFALGAMGVGALTHAAPALFGESRTEAYLTQPNVMAHAARGPLALIGTLNLEGYTLKRGELNAGIYGEGYVDRRHPHTLVHEVMMTITSRATRFARVSVHGGKGFVPFGTDDPMMRPFVKFPVNHHHAQIIERVLVGGALRVGNAQRGAAFEYATFNGDEPVGPFVGPQWDRVGDSHAARATLMPMAGVEVQASRAFVRSPGIIQGGAFDHRQTSVSLRVDRGDMAHAAHDAHQHNAGARQYLLAEVARTDEGFSRTPTFRFTSALVEGAVWRRGWRASLRAERTDRPENERLLDPFRIPNGHIDFQIIGITRWRVGTVHIAAPPVSWLARRRGAPQFMPYVEVGAARAQALRTPAVFVPRDFYGASTLWSFTTGVSFHVGTMRSRMGRYGVLAP